VDAEGILKVAGCVVKPLHIVVGLNTRHNIAEYDNGSVIALSLLGYKGLRSFLTDACE
jgi:hypothetical protein